jgi:hypothetical protein
MPAKRVLAGRQNNGATNYVCRAFDNGRQLAGKGDGSSCWVSYNWVENEHNNNRFDWLTY